MARLLAKGKILFYTVQVVEDAAMELAVENADMVGKSNWIRKGTRIINSAHQKKREDGR